MFRYSRKCRFAHGQEELRCVERHNKYKTEICRTFHLTGTCLYGVRCTFIHDEQPKVAQSPTTSASSVSSTSSVGDASPPTNFFATSFHPYNTTSLLPPPLPLPTSSNNAFSSAFSLDDDLLQSWGAMSLLAAPPTTPTPTKKDYSSIWSMSLDRRYSSSSQSSATSSLLSVPFVL